MNAVGRWLALPAVLRITRTVIGLVFLIAALAKLANVPWLAIEVHNYHLAPLWSENLVAIVLPWIELVAGLALVLGVRARAGGVVAFALMLMFTVAVAIAWARGLDFNCGCFGKLGAGRIGAQKFAENLGLTALAALAMRRPAR